ncbi:MAG: TerD family protein [Victivallales bacterium]|nr:TerD family protein [Victivallales bacterium]
MVINLQKGQTINLEKDVYDLSSVTVGLGWDVKESPKGLFSSLLGKKNENDDYDLNAIAFMLDSDGKVARLGDRKMVGGDVVFYNNLRHFTGYVYHTGDNRTGDGEGDAEQIIINLDKLDACYDVIVILASIYHGIQKHQDFGQVENAFIRAVDAKGREMLRYDLSNEEKYDGMCSMVFGEFYRRNGGWKFRAIGTPYATDSFVAIMREHFL